MNRGVLYYLMIPLLLLLSLLQSTTVARFKLAGVKPDLVLLLIVVWCVGLRRASGRALGLHRRAGVGHLQRRAIGGVEPGVDGERAGGGVGTSPLLALQYPGAAGRRCAGHVGLCRRLPHDSRRSWRWPACRVCGCRLLDTVRDIVLPVTVYNTALMLLLLAAVESPAGEPGFVSVAFSSCRWRITRRRKAVRLLRIE
jgi:hypothetical protein